MILSPTPSNTPSNTPSYSPTETSCPTPTPTKTATQTPTMTSTQTPTITPSPTFCFEPQAYMLFDSFSNRLTMNGWMASQGSTFRGMFTNGPSTNSSIFPSQMNAYIDYSGYTSTGFNLSPTTITGFSQDTIILNSSVVWSEENVWVNMLMPVCPTCPDGVYTQMGYFAANVSTNPIYRSIPFYYSGATIPQGFYRLYTTYSNTGMRLNTSSFEYFLGDLECPVTPTPSPTLTPTETPSPTPTPTFCFEPKAYAIFDSNSDRLNLSSWMTSQGSTWKGFNTVPTSPSTTQSIFEAQMNAYISYTGFTAPKNNALMVASVSNNQDPISIVNYNSWFGDFTWVSIITPVCPLCPDGEFSFISDGAFNYTATDVYKSMIFYYSGNAITQGYYRFYTTHSATGMRQINSTIDYNVNTLVCPATPTPTTTSTQTQTPSVSQTQTMTPTQTITPTCSTYTTQYLRTRLLGCSNFDLGLFDNPNFTGNANAICDYVVSGTAYGDLGTVYTGTETISSGDHIHTFNLNPILLPGECVSGFTVNSVVPVCPCVNVVFNQSTPTPTPTITQTSTPTTTPTMTPTPSVTPPVDECVCYQYTNDGDPEEVNSISYLDCNYEFQQIDDIPFGTSGYFCAILGSVTETEGLTYIEVNESFCGGCIANPQLCITVFNNSLDITITDVYVNGIQATPIGTWPNTTGNGGSLTIALVPGTYSVEVFHSCSVSGQRVSAFDSNSLNQCTPISTGSSSTTFSGVNMDNIQCLEILAEDGACV